MSLFKKKFYSSSVFSDRLPNNLFASKDVSKILEAFCHFSLRRFPVWWIGSTTSKHHLHVSTLTCSIECHAFAVGQWFPNHTAAGVTLSRESAGFFEPKKIHSFFRAPVGQTTNWWSRLCWCWLPWQSNSNPELGRPCQCWSQVGKLLHPSRVFSIQGCPSHW